MPGVPLQGRIEVSEVLADPPGSDIAANEYVSIINVSRQPADLTNQLLRVGAVR